MRFIDAVAGVLLTIPLFAQVPAEAPVHPEPPVIVEPAAAAPAAPAARVAADAGIDRPVEVQGTVGFSTSGANLLANLGGATSSTSFTVFDSADLPLFRVRGDGMAQLSRDQNAGTILQIMNANTASSSTIAHTALQFTDGTLRRAEIKSVGLDATSAGISNALQLWNFAAGPMLFATSGVERARIHADGGLSVGSQTNTGAKLYVSDSRDGVISMQIGSTPTVEANATQSEYGLFSQVAENVLTGVVNSGTVTGGRFRAALSGAGTLSWTVGQLIESGVQSNGSGTVTGAIGAQIVVMAPAGTVVNGYGVYINDVPATNDYGIYQAGANDTNYLAGATRIGTGTPAAANASALLHVSGDAHFTGTVSGGNIKAKLQDLAEWVPSTTDLQPGTVVVLNPDKRNEVMESGSAYDTSVAGVVSAAPGVILGEEGPDKEQIATTGRVLVRVDARTHPIRVGDLLVTSDVPGTAMRSEPMDIGGRKFHQPGTIIGKALEPLDSGTGEILVLLSMQ